MTKAGGVSSPTIPYTNAAIANSSLVPDIAVMSLGGQRQAFIDRPSAVDGCELPANPRPRCCRHAPLAGDTSALWDRTQAFSAAHRGTAGVKAVGSISSSTDDAFGRWLGQG